MTELLALSTLVTIALVAGVLVGLAFVAGLIALAVRRRGEPGPDIPAGMRPGPADEVLERRQRERVMGWGVLFVLLAALWLPALWLREPGQNVDDAIELISRSEERGSRWFQEADEENPTGFGCARCHGDEAQGGSVPFTPPGQQEVVEYPVPSLSDVCGRLTVEEIQTTIEQGREGTPMPSWSVRYAGPMNDQQILDLITYLVSIQTVTGDANLCLNPPVGEEGPAPGPTASASPGSPTSGAGQDQDTEGGQGGGPGDGGGGSPGPEASPGNG
jgi:mono/diheme cytochrome c family protein